MTEPFRWRLSVVELSWAVRRRRRSGLVVVPLLKGLEVDKCSLPRPEGRGYQLPPGCARLELRGWEGITGGGKRSGFHDVAIRGTWSTVVSPCASLRSLY